MNLFEFLSLLGCAVVIALLVRIERAIKTGFSIETSCRERQSLEANVRDLMPNLWVDYEFRKGMVSWFALATGPYDKNRESKWHWPAIADNLSRAHGQIPSDEIERLRNLSSEFYREAYRSQLLTELEVRYLLYWAWNLHFPDPTAAISDDASKFESELSNIRARFLDRLNG
jgi:hypothetical protein